MNELTFLTESQILGKDKIEIFDTIGRQAAMTDLSIVLGGFVYSDYFSNEGNSLKHRAGGYWTKDPNGYGDPLTIDKIGNLVSGITWSCQDGARPILPYSEISKMSSNKIRGKQGLLIVEYGGYPQWAPSKNYQLLLEEVYKNEKIKILEDCITVYNRKDGLQKLPIYEYRGKKYIRIKATPDKDKFRLSNGEYYKIYEDGKYFDVYIWIEITPIKWVVDEKKNIAITKDIIYAGIPFQFKEKQYRCDFSKTDINWFVNTHLIKDIEKNNIIQNINNTSEKTKIQLLLEEINILKQELNVAIEENTKLEKENSEYKKLVKSINNITRIWQQS